MDKKDIRTSKFLSLVLRHQPEVIGLSLDEKGWVPVDQLLDALSKAGRPLERSALERVVANDNKKRYAFSRNGRLIRASQGHSIPVDLGLEAQTPPEVLFHGTARQHLDGIWREGLKPQKRQFVHLSLDMETACNVGRRHGKLIVLAVQSRQMLDAGHTFYLSANGVWLVDRVPAVYLSLVSE